MAAGLLPDEGIADQLVAILQKTAPEVIAWQMLLWTNDYRPRHDTTFANLVEATWPGYFRVTLTRSEWSVPTVSNGCATSYWGTAPVDLTMTSGVPVTNYGIAYSDADGSMLRYVQRFDDDDVRLLSPGDVLRVWPVYTLTSAECGSIAARLVTGARRPRWR